MARSESGKKKISVVKAEKQKDSSFNGRIRQLEVKNFRCIGSEGVKVGLDKIVFLVGPNNAGKSSILRAYEAVLQDGSSQCALTLQDFPNRKLPQNEVECPEIVLETAIDENSRISTEWIFSDDKTGEKYVVERWRWLKEGLPERAGMLAETGKFATAEDTAKYPWGPTAIANANRPKPFRLHSFSSPSELIAKTIISSLSKMLKDSSANAKANDDTLHFIKSNIERVFSNITSDIEDIETKIRSIFHGVFPDHFLSISSPYEEELQGSFTKFIQGITPSVRIGTSDAPAHQGPIDLQGSGAQRLLMLAALKTYAEVSSGDNRSYLLLLDEPELCLHPHAIRDVCKILYEIADLENWQIMITTHSPIMINMYRDNTSIVRVARVQCNNKTDDQRSQSPAKGTTIYRSRVAQLNEMDKKDLKLLNSFDPYVAEFFFGGHIVIVEGDTEYAVFKKVIDMNSQDDNYRRIHVVRARGKYSIVTLCKIFNQFDSPYSILHDSDTPENIQAWPANQKILDVISPCRERVRVVAAVPDFERAFLGLQKGKKEKPHEALRRIMEDQEALDKIKLLLDGLIDQTACLPDGALAWASVSDIEKMLGRTSKRKTDKCIQPGLFPESDLATR